MPHFHLRWRDSCCDKSLGSARGGPWCRGPPQSPSPVGTYLRGYTAGQGPCRLDDGQCTPTAFLPNSSTAARRGKYVHNSLLGAGVPKCSRVSKLSKGTLKSCASLDLNFNPTEKNREQILMSRQRSVCWSIEEEANWCLQFLWNASKVR